MSRLWQTAALVLLVVLSLVGPVLVPKANASKTYADLYIEDFFLLKGEFLWFWKSQVYFKVVSYAPIIGWAIGYGSEWDTRDTDGWKTGVEKHRWYTVNYHNQVEYDISSFVQGYSVTFAFYAYKKGWVGDEQLLAEKITFPGPGHHKHIFSNDNIEFNVTFDWNPQVSTPGSPSGETNSVFVYAMSREYAGLDPDSNGVILEDVSIEVEYTLNGKSQPPIQSSTPFALDADVGSEIILQVTSYPSGWDFACVWDNYGHQFYQYPSCRLSTVVYSGRMRIIAFFDRESTPPPPPPPPTATQSVVIRSVSDQFWNSWNPSTSDLGASVNIGYTSQGQYHAYASTTPFKIYVDQGTEITVIAGQLSNWSFAKWNWYGDTYYHADTNWSTSVRGFRPEGYDSNFLAALYGGNLLFAVLPIPAHDIAVTIRPASLSAHTDHVLAGEFVNILRSFLLVLPISWTTNPEHATQSGTSLLCRPERPPFFDLLTCIQLLCSAEPYVHNPLLATDQ